MTSFAPPTVLRCPSCGDHVYRSRLASFNDFGAIGWSDGYTSIWGLNAISALGKCPWCKALFWLDDAEQVGVLAREPHRISWIERAYHRLTGDKQGFLARERAWQAIPWEWKSAKHIDLPGFADWLSALQDRATLTSVREQITRRQIWWLSNDHLRLKHDGTPWETHAKMSDDEARKNLEALLRLYEATPDANPVEIGELLRELGRFDDAIAVLSAVAGKQQQRALQIVELANCGDAAVREVWRSQYEY